MKLGSRLLIGALAGIAGTMAMSATDAPPAQARCRRSERYPLPPREIVDAALAPPDGPRPTSHLACHFAYGAGCGALLAAVNPRIGR